MMHVFHIRGLSGLLLMGLAVAAGLLLFLLLPAAFMMVLWNALAYETLGAPEIGLFQGLILWGIVAIALKLIFQPEIEFQFQQMDPPDQSDDSQ